MVEQDIYAPSPWASVAAHVERYERSSGADDIVDDDSGLARVILTTRGAKSGLLRKSPLMRVEHDGYYVVIGSVGGGPKDPLWCHNLRAHPEAVLQDGATVYDVIASELNDEQRAMWWARAVNVYAKYADYQIRTDRALPVFLLVPQAVAAQREALT